MTSLQTNSRFRAFTVVASLISLGIYAGCNYKTGNDNSGSGAPAVAAGAVPTYAVLTSTILQPKCFTCHDGNTAGAHDIRSFAAFSAELTDIKERIHDSSPQNHMPRGGNELTTSELATLDAWINAGGPQNGVAAGGTPAPTTGTTPAVLVPVPSFAEMTSAFLQSKCFRCHNGAPAVGPNNPPPNYSTYALFSAASKNIRNRITTPAATKGHMPPVNAHISQLTEEELTTLVTWIDEKSPEAGISEDQILPPVVATPTPVPVPVPSFADMKKAFLDSKCLSCHDGKHDKIEDLSTYALFSAASQKVFKHITLPVDVKGHMPPPSHDQLTVDELTTLMTWIQEKSPENGITAAPPPGQTPPPPQPPTPPQPPGPPVTSAPVLSYSDLSTQILAPKCFTCHDGTDPLGLASDLRDYKTFSNPKLMVEIRSRITSPPSNQSHMPQVDATHPALTDEELAKVVAWIDAGGHEQAPK